MRGVALVALGTLVALRRGGGGDPLGKTAAVERGRIERLVVASGTIEPEDDLAWGAGRGLLGWKRGGAIREPGRAGAAPATRVA